MSKPDKKHEKETVGSGTAYRAPAQKRREKEKEVREANRLATDQYFL